MKDLHRLVLAAAVALAGCVTPDTDTAGDSGALATPATPPAPGGADSGHRRGVDTTRPAVGGGCSATNLTGDGVGPVRIGATVDALRSQCAIVAEGTRPGPEGSTSRFVTVAMNADSVDAEIVDGRVWRVPVTSSRLRTQDGLGVGTPLARLLEIRDVRPAMGEGLYVLSPAHCGVSFQLANPGGSLPPATTVAELRRLPASTVVDRVLLTGCG